MENENIEEKYELRMLREEYERELIRYHTNNFVMSTLKELNVNKMKSLDSQSSENVADAISQLHLADYDHNGVKILGLDLNPIELNYLEKKEIQNNLAKELIDRSSAVLSLANNFDQSIFEPEKLNEEIEQLQKRQRQLQADVTEAKMKSVEKLREFCDLKCGPYQAKEAELLKGKAEVEEIRTAIVCDLVKDNIIKQTNHTDQALREMKSVLRAEINKINLNS